MRAAVPPAVRRSWDRAAATAVPDELDEVEARLARLADDVAEGRALEEGALVVLRRAEAALVPLLEARAAEPTTGG